MSSLEGFLRKKGVKGPRPSYKKRWFALRDQNRIYYYEKKTDTAAKGFIDLKEALSVVPTEPAKKGLYLFQINTPRRIYHLQADSQSSMDYWIQGTSDIIRSLASNEDVERLSALLEQANNRIQALENQLKSSRAAVEYAAKKLDTTADALVAEAGDGGDGSAGAASAASATSSEASAAEPAAAAAAEETKETAEETKEAAASEDKEAAAAETKEAAEEPAKKEGGAAAGADDAGAEAAAEKAADADKAAAEDASKKSEPVAADATPAAESKEAAKKEDAAAPAEAGKGDGTDSDTDEEDAKPVAGGASATTFGAQVLYDYNARKDYELTIHVNEIITVLSQHENGWWLGCNHAGKQGYFPGSYVRPLK